MISRFSTTLGWAVLGDALEAMETMADGSVNLICTSPPYAMLTPKEYGNETEARYLDWFRPFAESFVRLLTPDGSLVINIDGAWNRGSGTRSMYHWRLLLMLHDEFGLHLAQEHYWWNPSKMPNSYWSTVPRSRASTAVECVWWMSPSTEPKADNRNVLWPYRIEERHDRTITYHHPGGHTGHPRMYEQKYAGAVPHNLLAISNGSSNSAYQRHCREHGLRQHPARFPEALPAYFIRLCTDRGDVVLDPFAGSLTTGHAAEVLGRRWICCELDAEYIDGGIARFSASPEPDQLVLDGVPAGGPAKTKMYSIPAPNQIPESPIDP